MGTIIAAPASCKVRAVIRFLHAEGQSAAEIHRRLCRVYRDNVMSDNCVREWYRKFRSIQNKRREMFTKSVALLTTTRGSHTCFNQALQLGDFRLPSLQSGLGAK